MLSDDGLEGIVRWNSAGNGVLVLNVSMAEWRRRGLFCCCYAFYMGSFGTHAVQEDAFVTAVFPKYGFKTTRYSTFTRQLNLYQFVRVHSGKGTTEYANPDFLRDNLEAEGVRVPVWLTFAFFVILYLFVVLLFRTFVGRT